jgi:hypothetical protein
MEHEEMVRLLIEIAVWVALIAVSVGFKRGLQVVIDAIEKCDNKDVKHEVSLTAKGIAAFIINIMKQIAERKRK